MSARTIEEWESAFPLADPLKDLILQIQDSFHQNSIEKDKLLDLALLQGGGEPESSLVKFREARDSMCKYQTANVRKSQQMIELNRDLSSKAVQSIDEALKNVTSLLEKNSYVSSKTSSLKNECENLLATQLTLSEKAHYIEEKLDYFRGIDNVNRILDQMSAVTLTSTDADKLLSCLNLLDDYHAFIQAHGKYKDSALYDMRCKQSFSRALGFIKTFFSTTMNQLSQMIKSPSSQIQIDHEFKASRGLLKPIIQAVELRCEKHTEYGYGLQEMNSVYFTTRSSLISKPVQSFCSTLPRDKLSSESVSQACQFMLKIAFEEYQMYFEFFDSNEEDLIWWLGQVLSPVREIIRPLILAEKNMDLLGKLCRDINDLISTFVAEREPLKAVFNDVHQDCQTRLIFQVQSYIRSEMQTFAIDHSALEYPKILALEEDSNKIRVAGDSFIVYKPLVLLHRLLVLLYSSVNQEVFTTIIADSLPVTLFSIQQARDYIRIQSPMDALLFYIRHLLLIKLMTASFDINFQHEDDYLDFSGLQEFLQEISNMKIPSIAEMLQQAFPKVVSNITDPTAEVDNQLQISIENLLADIIKNLPSDIAKSGIIADEDQEYLKTFADKARLYIPDEFCDSLLFVSLASQLSQVVKNEQDILSFLKN